MKKRQKILNSVMVAAIVLMFAAGILAVGSLKGWFGAPQSVDTPAGAVSVTAEQLLGSVSLERGGVAYALENGTALRDGDVVETRSSASVDLAWGESTVSLDENSRVTLSLTEGGISLALSGGSLFADVTQALTLSVLNEDILLQNCVCAADAPYGSARVAVLAGAVTVGAQEVTQGNAVTLLSGGSEAQTLSLNALSHFALEKITQIGETKALCFTAQAVESLTREREEAKALAENARQLETEQEQAIEAQRQENEAGQTQTGDGAGASETAGSGSSLTCTIEIRCDTVLDHMDALAEGKNAYVPSGGVILSASSLSFSQGDTVFDALKKACTLADIQLEYAWTPIYNSYYVEGINNLYEFDCGNESGWVYKVNGWSPNYGCSAYTLKDGDTIVWSYTCEGLGTDVN